MKMLVYMAIERNKFISEEYITGDNLLFVVEEGSFYVNNGFEEQIIEKNNAMIFLPDVHYYRKVINPVKLHVFRFKTKDDLSNFPLKMIFSDAGRIKSSINLLKKLNMGIYPDDFKLKQDILTDILNQFSIENKYVFKNAPKEDKLMHIAIKMIERNFRKKVNLSQIASELCISYIQFSRRFKSYTGISPGEYLNEARMKLAIELLADEKMLIKHIAIECGYENEYYFSNCFKKYNGISPSEYRKRLLKV